MIVNVGILVKEVVFSMLMKKDNGYKMTNRMDPE